MTGQELAHLELFTQIDELIRRLKQWAETESPWAPMQRCQLLVQRLLKRVETLRIRLEAPLVAATFGGTGTGKSSLVNALVGTDVTRTGRERPTTMRPVLIAHPYTELEVLGLPLDDFEIVRVDSAILRDIIIIDFPDPDTSETDSPGSNLERLHRLLPHCDVLIYTSTQQKYRSARVVDELGQVATGCRLLFVQTHADLDEDIRADWRQQLDGRYDVPDVFFVDSVRALKEQRSGHRPSGDFGRLLDVLTTQLGVSQRGYIRRANLIDLIDAALERCREQTGEHWPAVRKLELMLEEQRQSIIRKMAGQLRDELKSSQNLWERRLLSAVTEIWGFSPFSSMLRLYNGLGGLIASSTLFRARTSAQIALIGAVQGSRWLAARQKERDAESQLERLGSFGLDDAALREAEVVISGYVHEAQLDPALIEEKSLDQLRHQAVQVEGQFLGDAGRRINEIIDHLARRNSGVLIRVWYEVLFLLFVGFLLVRAGKNFFVDSLIYDEPHLTVDFYVSAGFFFLLWSGMLVMLFVRRLSRGLTREIDAMAQELAESKVSRSLFPQLEQACAELERQRDRLESAAAAATDVRLHIAKAPGLGAPTVNPLVESLP